MNEPKFKIGDKVRVLDGAKIHDYYGSWVHLMGDCVGKIYEVDLVRYDRSGRNDKYGYWLKGLIWNFDERGLELVEAEEPVERITIYREGRKVIAKNELTGEKGVARCSPEDEFNFGFGSYLALKRLFAQGFKIGSYIEPIDNGMDFDFRTNIPLQMCRHKFTVKGAERSGGVKVATENGLLIQVNPFAIVEDKALTYFTGKAVYVGNKYLGLFTRGKIYEFKDGKGFYDDGGGIRNGAFKSVAELNAWLEEEGFVEIVE